MDLNLKTRRYDELVRTLILLLDFPFIFLIKYFFQQI